MEKKESKLTEEIFREKVLGALQPLAEWMDENSQEIGMMVCIGVKGKEGPDDNHVILSFNGSKELSVAALATAMIENRSLRNMVLNAVEVSIKSSSTKAIEAIRRNMEEKKKGGEE